MERIPELMEILMIVSFGASWPLNVMKSYKARTAKGKSLSFLLLIIFGYIAGIAGKFIKIFALGQSVPWYVLFFYFLNLIMVSTDLCLYFRNKKLDATKND